MRPSAAPATVIMAITIPMGTPTSTARPTPREAQGSSRAIPAVDTAKDGNRKNSSTPTTSRLA